MGQHGWEGVSPRKQRSSQGGRFLLGRRSEQTSPSIHPSPRKPCSLRESNCQGKRMTCRAGCMRALPCHLGATGRKDPNFQTARRSDANFFLMGKTNGRRNYDCYGLDRFCRAVEHVSPRFGEALTCGDPFLGRDSRSVVTSSYCRLWLHCPAEQSPGAPFGETTVASAMCASNRR
uniref:Uncharacterized protein n=1 Tax=Trichuris muris TaxID=70415 RepID=A0A5S6Q8Z9_TRIMR